MTLVSVVIIFLLLIRKVLCLWGVICTRKRGLSAFIFNFCSLPPPYYVLAFNIRLEKITGLNRLNGAHHILWWWEARNSICICVLIVYLCGNFKALLSTPRPLVHWPRRIRFLFRFFHLYTCNRTIWTYSAYANPEHKQKIWNMIWSYSLEKKSLSIFKVSLLAKICKFRVSNASQNAAE